MNLAVGIAGLLPQWLSVVSAFWLIWWAARSRDAVAFKATALVLAIVPGVVMPIFTTFVIPQYHGTGSNMATMIALVVGGTAVVRALFLVTWAIVSKDEASLRAVGGAIGGMILAVYLLGAAAVMWIGSLGS